MQFTLQTQPNIQKYVAHPQNIPRQMQCPQNTHLNIFNAKPTHQNIIQHNYQKQQNLISYSNPCDPTIRNIKENMEIQNTNNNMNNNNKNNRDSEQYNRLEQRIDKLVEENRQVNQQLVENGSQMKQFEILNSKMEIELHRLRGQDQEMKLIKEMNELRQRECENSQQKIIDLQGKLNAANIVLSEMEMKLSIYENQEFEWKKKQNDIEQLKLSNLDEIRSQLQKNNNEIIESIKQKYEEKIKLLENNLDVLSVEFEQSQNQISELTEQVKQWKIKYTKIQVNQKQSISRLGETEQEHIQMLIEEIESLNQQLNDRNMELEQQKLLIESATEYVPQLKDENQQLKEQLDSISEELENLKQQFN